jgi:hypothetical protein
MSNSFEPGDCLPEFIDHKTIEIPILCGYNQGKVFIYSNKNTLENGLLDKFTAKVKSLIEIKKYHDSEKVHKDIGPIVPSVDAVEDGDYINCVNDFVSEVKGGDYDSLLIKKYAGSGLLENEERLKKIIRKINYFKDEFEMDPLEHVLKVKNGYNSYLVLPLISGIEHSFKMAIQRAVIRYAVLHNLKKSKDDVREDVLEWITTDDKKNAIIFDKTLCETRVTRIDGYDREYKCPLYKGFFTKLFENFSMDENEAQSLITKKESLVSVLMQ